MSESVEVETTRNGNHSSVAQSERLREPPKTFITKFMKPKTFDKVCMVLAEFLGTASLLFFGCAGTVHWDGPPVPMQPPVSFGLTVMMVIQMFGHISFALLNPAVVICAVINNLISIKMGFVLTIAQILGAIVGFGMLRFFVPEDIFWAPPDGTCSTVVHPGVSITQAFFFEFFLTSGLMTMICGVWDPRNRNNVDSGPLRVGFSIVALSIAGGPFTSASMNPARSLGPALWTGNWDNHWVFWAGPMCAGLVAPLFYKIIFWRRNPQDELQEEIALTRPQTTKL